MEDFYFKWSKKPVAEGQERKQMVENTKRAASESVSQELEDRAYEYSNSVLSNRGKYGYETGDERDYSFEGTFLDVLPEGQTNLKEYIETTLTGKKGEAIGVEFGGLGSELFAGFSPGFFKKTAGITLADNRENLGKVDPSHKPVSIAEDDVRHHSVIEGNILDDHLYTDLNKWLEGKKVDLILERMIAGMDHIPADPYTISKIMSRWYELLDENGILFVQVPPVLHDQLPAWVEMIQEKYGDVLEVQIKNGHEQFELAFDLLRIHKLPGAPEKLPLLNPRIVKEIGAATLEIFDERDL